MSEPPRKEEPGEDASKAQDPLFRGASEGKPTNMGLWIAVALAVVAGGVGFYATRTSPGPTPLGTASATVSPPPPPAPIPEGATVEIEAGSFSMGGADGEQDEQPVREVSVAAFLLDKAEVTVDAFSKCVDAGKCEAPDTGLFCNWKKPDRGRHPVNCVDHRQAGAYCAFAGKRLPTEEEWEYAARGRDGRRFPWKDGAPGAQVCWNGEGNDLGKGKRQGTCIVGTYPAGASPFGALDMAGNVWEWTSSAYCPYASRTCGEARKAIRGGGWNNLIPEYVRAQDRAKEPPTARNDNLGFRCARDR